MATGNAASQNPDGNENGIDEQEVRRESAKAAQQAQEAQQKAYELRQAAHGAADADERQKIMEKAIDKEIESESFGKTAKYLRSGTFQGMAVGAGVGAVPGVTLGTLTGTLVGGLVSTITGGLGGAAGAITGAIHGPWWNMGEVTGKGIRSITGDLPSWKATPEQKWTLEKMIGQAKEEEMPTAHELEFMRKDDGNGGKGWGESVTSMMPSMPSWTKSSETNTNQQKRSQSAQPKPSPQPTQTTRSTSWRDTRGAAQAANERAGDDLARHLSRQQAHQTPRPVANRPAQANDMPTAGKAFHGVEQMKTSAANAPRPAARQPESRTEAEEVTHYTQKETHRKRKKPRKLETRTESADQPPMRTAAPDRKPPRKLERRS